ncbi:hypothetical protein [Vagococcus lutrae]|uniref:Uncharacterized protein n=1 Tax=Vagococcus lutrae LBD1 TaxID=1408226 RepID=V6Q455_9ENTE|nr:hypothetical protein [Vagococcus lutrae]EST89909.1 hypothetical protein T233_01015 [Vagococcus lutrae LBD1]MDT2824859.1 hypothetical protein [Vagococcus lutrae]
MGIKLRDFVKNKELELTNEVIDDLLISIIGQPKRLCLETNFLKSETGNYNYINGTLLPYYSSRGYGIKSNSKQSVTMSGENKLGVQAA